MEDKYSGMARLTTEADQDVARRECKIEPDNNPTNDKY